MLEFPSEKYDSYRIEACVIERFKIVFVNLEYRNNNEINTIQRKKKEEVIHVCRVVGCTKN